MQIAKEPIEEWFQTILGLKWHSMVIWIELITLSPIPSFFFFFLFTKEEVLVILNLLKNGTS